MVNKRYSYAMTETLHYLKGIRQDDLNKIPNKFMSFLNENCSKDYICDFDYTKPLKDIKLSNEARGIISMICLNYWCETDEHKEKFKNHLSENELKYQEELRKKYNLDKVFRNNTTNINVETQNNINENTKIIEYQKQRWYQKIFARLLKIFRKN